MATGVTLNVSPTTLVEGGTVQVSGEAGVGFGVGDNHVTILADGPGRCARRDRSEGVENRSASFNARPR